MIDTPKDHRDAFDGTRVLLSDARALHRAVESLIETSDDARPSHRHALTDATTAMQTFLDLACAEVDRWERKVNGARSARREADARES